MTTAAPIFVGTFDGFTWIRCEGKGSFVSAPKLKEYGEARVEAGERLLVIDLAACTGMDSTFMGTLAGLAIRMAKSGGGVVQVAEPGPRNRGSLEDLGLGALLEIEPAAAVWRARAGEVRAALVPVAEAPQWNERRRAEQVLEAHRVLSAANESNARKFAGVVQVLETELASKPGNA